MANLFGNQTAVKETVSPPSEYQPVPFLKPIAIADQLVGVATVASITVFLGSMGASDAQYVVQLRIVDEAAGSKVVAESVFAGSASPITVVLHAFYEIAANAKPKLVAQWKGQALMSSSQVVLATPTTASFTASVDQVTH